MGFLLAGLLSFGVGLVMDLRRSVVYQAGCNRHFACVYVSRLRSPLCRMR
jgi:hypothetical protein